MLVPWANDLIYELGQMQRWSFEFTTKKIQTNPGQNVYPFSTFIQTGNLNTGFGDTQVDPWTQESGLTAIKRIYYIDGAGVPRELDRRERFEATRILGDTQSGKPVPAGAPREWAITAGNIEIFPPPNSAGYDNSGNYMLWIECYTLTPPIVETTGSTTSGSPVLTVPSTDYLKQFVSQSGSLIGKNLSIRNAGYPLGTGNDQFITDWNAMPTPTTVTLAVNIPSTTSNTQVFFNSQPWQVIWAPKLMEFGVLREVATYLKDLNAYNLYEQRYQTELTLLRAYEYDKMRGVEMSGAAHSGQYTPVDRRQDLPVGLDVRGMR